MNKLFLSTLLLLVGFSSFAQMETFGIVNYAVPANYELVKNDNVLTYYKEDKSTGAYCNFFIYKIMPGKGGTKSDFDFAWDKLMQAPFKFTASPEMQPEATLKGWKFLIGNARYNDNGVATMAMLINFSGENNMQAVCILSNSDKYKTDIENFIASVDVAKDISGKSFSDKINTKAQSNPVINAKNISFNVWMCHCFDAGGKLGDKKFKTIVISSENKVIYQMPEKGLNGVTPENSNETGS